MSAFIPRFALTVFAAVLITGGAEAHVKDLSSLTSSHERISVEAWEAAEARAYDRRHADRITAIDRTLRDGARWAVDEGRGVALAAAAEGHRLAGDVRRLIAESADETHRFAAAAVARHSGRDIVVAVRDMLGEGRRLVAEARGALAEAVAARRQMAAQVEAGPTVDVAMAVRTLAAETRRFAAEARRAVAAMRAESERAAAHATLLRYTALREAAREAALAAPYAYRGGRAALRLMMEALPVVKAGLRVDLKNAIGEVMAARFAAAPEAATEAAPAIRVWKLSHRGARPVDAALAGGVATGGLAEPAAPVLQDGDAGVISARFNAAVDAVQQAGRWLWSIR